MAIRRSENVVGGICSENGEAPSECKVGTLLITRD